MKLTQKRKGVDRAVECLPPMSVSWKPKYSGNDLVRRGTRLFFFQAQLKSSLRFYLGGMDTQQVVLKDLEGRRGGHLP